MFNKNELIWLKGACNDAIKYLNIMIDDDFTEDNDIEEYTDCKKEYLKLRKKIATEIILLEQK